MTGDEHYREAETMLGAMFDAQQNLAASGGSKEDLSIFTSSVLAAAQVHATLALAAATHDPSKVGYGI